MAIVEEEVIGGSFLWVQMTLRQLDGDFEGSR
jgi:hypothetical protein